MGRITIEELRCPSSLKLGEQLQIEYDMFTRFTPKQYTLNIETFNETTNKIVPELTWEVSGMMLPRPYTYKFESNLSEFFEIPSGRYRITVTVSSMLLGEEDKKSCQVSVILSG